MRVIKDTCYKGTRILLGNAKRTLLNKMMEVMYTNSYQEIFIPIIQQRSYFESKVGKENNNIMYLLTDKSKRDLCLAPEYTVIIQQLGQQYFKQQKDIKVFYVAECFRGEKPQRGRYRQFTQFGVEIINPSNKEDSLEEVIKIAEELVDLQFNPIETVVSRDVKRGLNYYSFGFEILAPKLGSSSQICGGGVYDNGVGFAIGIDRILN